MYTLSAVQHCVESKFINVCLWFKFDKLNRQQNGSNCKLLLLLDEINLLCTQTRNELSIVMCNKRVDINKKQYISFSNEMKIQLNLFQIKVITPKSLTMLTEIIHI